MTDVSIIVTNYNTREALRKCLSSIGLMTRVCTYEIIVVDDASNDGSAEMVHQQFPKVRLHKNARNLGYAHANNIGVSVAKGKFILLLNSDTVLLNDVVSMMCAFLLLNSKVGAVGANLVGSVSYGHEPSVGQALADVFFLNHVFPGKFPCKGIIPDRNIKGPIEVEYVSGACLMMRREDSSYSLLDADFGVDCEDVDLCRRLRDCGKAVYFLPEARVLHTGGLSYGKDTKERLARRRRSTYAYLRKYHGTAYSGSVMVLGAWHDRVRRIFA